MSELETGTEFGGLQKFLRGLQSKVRPDLILFDVGELEPIYKYSRHICRVDIEEFGGTPASGTGFLVGPNLVLTNYHVIEPAKFQPQHIKCRFDYRSKGNGNFTIGRPVNVRKIVDWSRYSTSEASGTYTIGSEDHPADHELDYALLRLARCVGRDILLNQDGVYWRGWIPLHPTQPVADPTCRLYILQHPLGQPVKHADGPPHRLQPSANRFRYETTTEHGSSGSPCFQTSNGQRRPVVVALHNYGDPAWRRIPEFNHGIPIHRIVKDVTHRFPGEPIPLLAYVLALILGIVCYILWPPTSTPTMAIEPISVIHLRPTTEAPLEHKGNTIWQLSPVTITLAGLALSAPVESKSTYQITHASLKLTTGSKTYNYVWFQWVDLKDVCQNLCRDSGVEPFDVRPGVGVGRSLMFRPMNNEPIWKELNEAIHRNDSISIAVKFSYRTHSTSTIRYNLQWSCAVSPEWYQRYIDHYPNKRVPEYLNIDDCTSTDTYGTISQ